MNNTVAYEAEPVCASPQRIIGHQVKALPTSELACLPLVSPTSSFQEIIQGKNMSLVCTVTATPMATITWWYKGLLINNGSTMVSDIDMRLYYYRNVETGKDTLKSELILLRTNLDDNGTFHCMAENNAGQAVANFTLSVVIPFPPKPPQDVVEDRFQQEYVIAIGVAGVIVSILTIVIIILVAVKCRALRNRRRHSLAESKVHLYQSSVTGSDMSESHIRSNSPICDNSLDLMEVSAPCHRGFAHGDQEANKLAEPDLISHAVGTKHRRKVIAVPVEKVNNAI